jgi:hypothetical protein
MVRMAIDLGAESGEPSSEDEVDEPVPEEPLQRFGHRRKHFVSECRRQLSGATVWVMIRQVAAAAILQDSSPAPLV